MSYRNEEVEFYLTRNSSIC